MTVIGDAYVMNPRLIMRFFWLANVCETFLCCI